MKKHIHLFKRDILVLAGILMISSLLFSSCKKNGASPDKPANAPIMFEGTAKPSSNNVSTGATGSLTAKFVPDTKMLSYTFQWKGLTGKIGGFHIHKGDGSIIIDFKDASYSTDTAGTFSGSSTLTDDSWIQDLKAGKLYGQIHTQKYPGGEIIFPFTVKDSAGGGNNGGGDNGGGDNGGGDGGYTPPVY